MAHSASSVTRLFLPLVLTAHVGCNAGGPSNEQPAGSAASTKATPSPLEEQVLARHDSLMIATGRLFDLRRKLGTLRPALAADSAHNGAALRRLDAATGATVAADGAMTDWMHAYHRPAAGTAPDSADAYFRRQQVALDQVASLTKAAHDSAEAVYREFASKAGKVEKPTSSH